MQCVQNQPINDISEFYTLYSVHALSTYDFSHNHVLCYCGCCLLHFLCYCVNLKAASSDYIISVRINDHNYLSSVFECGLNF